MISSVDIQRKTIPVTFSRSFEHVLLALPTEHTSITHDLEICALKGLELLSELKDVRELAHVSQIMRLVEETNSYSDMDSEHFDSWHIAVSEDLLDDIDLLTLTHGDDLVNFGLKDTSQGSILLLLAVTGKYHPDLVAKKASLPVPAFA